jgi:hypothetical protein
VTASPGLKTQVLAESGKQYAIYIFGKGPHTFELTVPPGNYVAEFMDPLTGKLEEKQKLESMGTLKLTSPAYEEDLAVKITIQQ